MDISIDIFPEGLIILEAEVSILRQQVFDTVHTLKSLHTEILFRSYSICSIIRATTVYSVLENRPVDR
jgi:hypothetical protein